MKIGIVTTWFERGAAYVSKQFKNVLESDHNIFIYARSGEDFAIGDKNWDGDYVTWAKKPLTFAFTDINLNDFKKWLISNQIDLVLFNEQKIWAPVLLCRDLGIRTGAYIDYYTEEMVPCFGIHDFLICNTQRHLSVFKKHPQCLYFPWGTDLDLYQPKTLNAVNKNKITFFHSAGMSPYRKGTDMLIRAFYRLKGQAKLIIHSQVDIVKALPEVSSIINELLESKCLELHEYTVSAPGLYHLGDVYVYPSRLDGIGLTILEAASSGLPVIVPDNGPMNEFVSNDENGKTVLLNKLWSRWDGYYWPQCEVSINSLIEALTYYINNFNNITVLKSAARSYAEEHFSWSNNTKDISSALLDIKLLDKHAIQPFIEKAKKYDKKMLSKHTKSRKQRLADNLENKAPKLYKLLKG